MLAGALPLVIYNIARPLETLALQRSPWPDGVAAQSRHSRTNHGRLCAVRIPDRGRTRAAARRAEALVSIAIARGEPLDRDIRVITPCCGRRLRRCCPWRLLWNSPARRPILFGLIACAATWLPMVLTAGAGGAAHHVILLWPFQLLPIAAVLARIPAAPAALVTALLCGSNLAVTNQYYADLIRNGPGVRWTDAMDPLQRYLDGSSRPADRRRGLGIHGDHESAERRRAADDLHRHRQRPGR